MLRENSHETGAESQISFIFLTTPSVSRNMELPVKFKYLKKHTYIYSVVLFCVVTTKSLEAVVSILRFLKLL